MCFWKTELGESYQGLLELMRAQQDHDDANSQIFLLPNPAKEVFTLKNPSTTAGFEPANLRSRDEHVTPGVPRPTSQIIHNTEDFPWIGSSETDLLNARSEMEMFEIGNQHLNRKFSQKQQI